MTLPTIVATCQSIGALRTQAAPGDEERAGSKPVESSFEAITKHAASRSNGREVADRDFLNVVFKLEKNRHVEGLMQMYGGKEALVQKLVDVYGNENIA